MGTSISRDATGNSPWIACTTLRVGRFPREVKSRAYYRVQATRGFTAQKKVDVRAARSELQVSQREMDDHARATG